MREAYLDINGVGTRVSTYGKWIEESVECNEDIVIIIPGNPGITGFYDKFAKLLHESLGYSVWCIGHAGHNIPKERISPLPALKGNEELYGLKGQIKSKAEFLEKYVPKDGNIHIIAHSIGAYMALDLLKHPSIRDRLVDMYLLFPAVEYIAETKGGKILNWFAKYILWLIIFMAGIFNLFPTILQNILLNIYMFVTRTSTSQHRHNIKMLIQPAVLRRVFFLAFEEMEQVRERNNVVIKENVEKIRFLYGKKDRWAPFSYYENIKKDIPNVDAHVCGLQHAFVLRQSAEVALIVSDWIKSKK
ncbi:unnamed protein product [Acanthoscelides obtectus]|uniref:Lipid droplet-associated hydrolase n=1 Tax=Acanthoscelides obtectus TaxID=200917 RepID=A0A9P0M0I4_ACAOB|nr:unnamed protein product [Acanthoscelides obtectus]CAK1638280.1 Lipid droplet-associated hydrolase [Acanthoscelides obtectus]